MVAFEYDTTRGGYVAVATEDIKKDAEVFRNYGSGKPASNFDLFVDHGLVYEDNKHDETRVELTLTEDCIGYDKKATLLPPFLRSQFFNIKADLSSRVMEKFIGFVRLIVADPGKHPGELKEIHRASQRALLLSEQEYEATMKRFYSGTKDQLSKSFFNGYLQSISKRNELATWDYIDKFCLARLKEYKTTIEQDNKLLYDKTGKKLQSNQRNCILYRRSEKMILKSLREYAAKAI